MDSHVSSRQRTVIAKSLVLTRHEGSTLIRAYSTGSSSVPDLSADEIIAAVEEVRAPIPAAEQEEITA